jgi:hypothetical protein
MFYKIVCSFSISPMHAACYTNLTPWKQQYLVKTLLKLRVTCNISYNTNADVHIWSGDVNTLLYISIIPEQMGNICLFIYLWII